MQARLEREFKHAMQAIAEKIQTIFVEDIFIIFTIYNNEWTRVLHNVTPIKNCLEERHHFRWSLAGSRCGPCRCKMRAI